MPPREIHIFIQPDESEHFTLNFLLSYLFSFFALMWFRSALCVASLSPRGEIFIGANVTFDRHFEPNKRHFQTHRFFSSSLLIFFSVWAFACWGIIVGFNFARVLSKNLFSPIFQIGNIFFWSAAHSESPMYILLVKHIHCEMKYQDLYIKSTWRNSHTIGFYPFISYGWYVCV